MSKKDKIVGTTLQANEGEGNQTAARAYNKQAKHFAKSGKVEKKAREAAQAIVGPESAELARAEAEGMSHGIGAAPRG